MFRFKVMILLIFFSAILREMGLEEKMTTDQMAKKWENMKARYKVGLTANCVFQVPNFTEHIQQFNAFHTSLQGCKIPSHWCGEEPHLLEMV